MILKWNQNIQKVKMQGQNTKIMIHLSQNIKHIQHSHNTKKLLLLPLLPLVKKDVKELINLIEKSENAGIEVEAIISDSAYSKKENLDYCN